jgi:hypothetical protein
MAATETGSIIHIFGVDGAAIAALMNATMQSVSQDIAPALNEDVMDDTGVVIQKRYDDIRSTVQGEGILIGSGKFAGSAIAPNALIGATFDFDGKSHIVEQVGLRGQNRGFANISITGVHYPGVEPEEVPA